MAEPPTALKEFQQLENQIAELGANLSSMEERLIQRIDQRADQQDQKIQALQDRLSAEEQQRQDDIEQVRNQVGDVEIRIDSSLNGIERSLREIGDESRNGFKQLESVISNWNVVVESVTRSQDRLDKAFAQNDLVVARLDASIDTVTTKMQLVEATLFGQPDRDGPPSLYATLDAIRTHTNGQLKDIAAKQDETLALARRNSEAISAITHERAREAARWEQLRAAARKAAQWALEHKWTSVAIGTGLGFLASPDVEHVIQAILSNLFQ